jgi:hypothetical protein
MQTNYKCNKSKLPLQVGADRGCAEVVSDSETNDGFCETRTKAQVAQRRPGLLKNLQFSETFFDPLPDELIDAFFGKRD